MHTIKTKIIQIQSIIATINKIFVWSIYVLLVMLDDMLDDMLDI